MMAGDRDLTVLPGWAVVAHCRCGRGSHGLLRRDVLAQHFHGLKVVRVLGIFLRKGMRMALEGSTGEKARLRVMVEKVGIGVMMDVKGAEGISAWGVGVAGNKWRNAGPGVPSFSLIQRRGKDVPGLEAEAGVICGIEATPWLSSINPVSRSSCTFGSRG